jgi:hypothetical protein
MGLGGLLTLLPAGHGGSAGGGNALSGVALGLLEGATHATYTYYGARVFRAGHSSGPRWLIRTTPTLRSGRHRGLEVHGLGVLASGQVQPVGHAINHDNPSGALEPCAGDGRLPEGPRPTTATVSPHPISASWAPNPVPACGPWGLALSHCA